MTLSNQLHSMYAIDSEEWLARTIKLLQEKRLDELDLEHLIEELKTLGRRDRLVVESLLEQIIRHLLLLQYWSEQYGNNANHWKAEVISFRSQLDDYLTTDLQKHLHENKRKVYRKAFRYVRQKTGFSITFPEECPYNFEQLMDMKWFP